MSIGALNSVLSSALYGTYKTKPAAETAPDPAATNTAAAAPAENSSGTALVGNTTASLSAETQGAITLGLNDLPSISITEIRQRAMDAYDTDKNGTIDDSEWQNYNDIAQRAGLGDAKPLDFRAYDPSAQPTQVFSGGITILPYKPSADGGEAQA